MLDSYIFSYSCTVYFGCYVRTNITTFWEELLFFIKVSRQYEQLPVDFFNLCCQTRHLLTSEPYGILVHQYVSPYRVRMCVSVFV